MGAAAITAYNPPNAAKSQGSLQHPLYPEHRVLLGDRLMGCDRRPDPRLVCYQGSQDGNEWAAARSEHPGGVFAARADGSVEFYNDEISLVVWQALASRAGGSKLSP